MLVVACPKCEKQLNLPETSLGRRVRCAGCQAIVLVPSQVEEDQPPTPPPVRRSAAPPPLPRQPDPEDALEGGPEGAMPAARGGYPARRGHPAQPQAPSRLGYWVVVILIAVLMVACGIFAAVYLNKK